MSSDHDAVDVRVEFDGLLALLAFHGALGGKPDADFLTDTKNFTSRMAKFYWHRGLGNWIELSLAPGGTNAVCVGDVPEARMVAEYCRDAGIPFEQKAGADPQPRAEGGPQGYADFREAFEAEVCAAGPLPATVVIDGVERGFAELLEDAAEDGGVPDTMPRGCCEALGLPQGSDFRAGAEAALALLRRRGEGDA